MRLGLIWKAVEPAPGEYDEAYLESIRETAELLAAEGIWTLLDFHQDLYNEKYEGEGAPDWAVQDDGLPNAPKLGFPFNYFVNIAMNRAFDNFWKNAPGPGGVGLQDRYAGGVAPRRGVLQRDARRHGIRPVQRAVARHHVSLSAPTRSAARASTAS